MAILAGVGTSSIHDSQKAVDEALEKALPALAGNFPSVIIVLASPTSFNQLYILKFLQDKFPNSPIIGCSTSGEITSLGTEDKSLALMLIFSDQVKFVPGIGTNIKENARKAGQEFADSILKRANGEKPKVIIMFPDGLSGNGSDIVRGIQDIVGQDSTIVGGSAGDDFLFKQTYQYANGQVLTNNVVGLGLYGPFSYGIGVRHGWIPIGTGRFVTKAEGNILYELDGKPAVEIYQDQFGSDITFFNPQEPFAKLAITYPLGIALPGSDEHLIRDPLSVNAHGAITCAAEIPINSEVYIMIGSQDDAIAAAETAARTATSQVAGKTIRAAFLFNCIARKKLLMGKRETEIERIRSIIGQSVSLLGFYTYGEQAPIGDKNISLFHNETDVLFVLADD